MHVFGKVRHILILNNILRSLRGLLALISVPFLVSCTDAIPEFTDLFEKGSGEASQLEIVVDKSQYRKDQSVLVTIEVQDADGGVVSDFDGSVDLVLAPTAGTATGSGTVSISSGVGTAYVSVDSVATLSLSLSQPSMDTLNVDATSSVDFVSACVEAGNYWDGSDCVEATVGSFSAANDDSLYACPANRTTTSTGAQDHSSCLAEAGYFGADTSSAASSVGVGYFSASLDNSQSACPANSSTLTANSSSINECLGVVDFYSCEDGICDSAGVGYYSPANDNTIYSCTVMPNHATSVTWSSSGSGSDSCTYSSVSGCESGWTAGGSSCLPDNPTGFVIADASTSSMTVTNSSVSLSYSTGSTVVSKYCISTIQSTAPASGVSPCNSVAGELASGSGVLVDGNGWYYGGVPGSFTFSGTESDGLKNIYIWVADSDNNVNSGVVSASIDFDKTSPAVTIEQNGSQFDPVNSLPIEFDITFSEDIDDSSFTVADISWTGTASGITANLIKNSETSYSLSVISISIEGTVVPQISTAVLTDLAQNNNSASTSTDNSVTYDISSPGISGFTMSPGNFSQSGLLMASITFTETVYVTGSPTVDLDIGGATRTATYSSGSGSNTLYFSYTVGGADFDNDGVRLVSPIGVDVSNAIKDAALNNSNTSFAPTVFGTVLVDGVLPTVTNVTSSTADGYYRSSITINIEVEFDEIVNVAFGSPQLKLSNGEYAVYNSGSGSNTLLFDYFVDAGDSDSADLDIFSTAALELNGATIKDGFSNSADLTLMSPGAPGSLSQNKDIVIDNTSPTDPSFDLENKLFTNDFTVTISGTIDSNFDNYYYTLDGTPPTCGAVNVGATANIQSTSPTGLAEGSDRQLRVIACDLAGNSSSEVSSQYRYVNLDIVSLIDSSPNWNDFAMDSGGFIKSEATCDGASDCYHAGQYRAVVVDGLSSCSEYGALTLTDSLSMFDWSCEYISGHGVTFYNKGFQSGKDIRDMIDYSSASPFWKTLKVTLSGAEVEGTVESIDTSLWSNAVMELPDTSAADTILSESGKIYVYKITQESRGIGIGADGISILAFDNAELNTAMRSNMWGCDYTSAAFGGGGSDKCLIKSNSNYNLFMINTNGDNGGTTSDAAFVFYDADYNRVEASKINSYRSYGMNIQNSNRNKIIKTEFSMIRDGSDVMSSTNGNAILVQNSQSNFIKNVSISSGLDGLVIQTGQKNKLNNIKIANYGRYGIALNASTGNSLSNINVYNGQKGGSHAIYMGASKDNVLTNALIAGGENYGLNLVGTNYNNVFSNFTVMNFKFNGVRINSSSHNNTFVNLLVANSQQDGVLVAGSTGNQFYNLVSNNNSNYGIKLNAGADSTFFHGILAVNDNVSGGCYTDGSLTILGISMGSSCTAMNSSDHTVDSSINAISSSFVGAVSLPMSYVLVSDWLTGSYFNVWGLDGIFLSPATAGACKPGYTCHEYGFGLSSADAKLLSSISYRNDGNSSNTINHTWYSASSTDFLLGSYEVFDADSTSGNHNGLCESGEECVMNPNFGAYPGHGNLSVMTFTDGLISGVTAYKYDTNGY